MAIFNIYGEIVDNEATRMSQEDVYPMLVQEFLNGLDDNEPAVFYINSPGGSVTAGIAIANMLKSASANGHKTTAVVEGVAASIASVIMCACDEIQLYDTAIVMVHNCWGSVTGNANDLRKAAEVMDTMRESIMAFYREKFYMSDDEIIKMLDNETWFTGSQSEQYKLECSVISNDQPVHVAANATGFMKLFKNYKKIEKYFMTKDEEKIEEEKKEEQETVEQDKKPCEAEVPTKVPAEEPEEKPEEKPEEQEKEEAKAEEDPEKQEDEEKTEEPKAESEDDEEKEDEDEVVEAVVKDVAELNFKAKLDEQAMKFKAMLDEKDGVIKAKDAKIEELKASFTKLQADIDELKSRHSMLNASVNRPDSPKDGYWACKTREERANWCKKNLKWK